MHGPDKCIHVDSSPEKLTGLVTWPFVWKIGVVLRLPRFVSQSSGGAGVVGDGSSDVHSSSGILGSKDI